MGASTRGASAALAKAAIAIALITTSTAVAAAPARGRASAGRGTGTSLMRAANVSIDAAEDVVVDLVDFRSTATLDKQRQKSPTNYVEGTLKAATVDLGPAGAEYFPRDLGTMRVFRDEAGTGADRKGGNLSVQFSVPGDLTPGEIGATNADVAALLTDVEATPSSAVPNGLVANGAVRPINLEAVYNVAGASFAGGSTVDSVEALGGLVRVSGLTVFDQESSATSDVARGAIRELAVDSVRVVGLNELLGLLGLDRGEIPLATLAAMADGLGLPVSGTLGAVATTNLGSTWATATSVLTTSKTDLEAQLGGVCAALPGDLTGRLATAGVACSGTVQQALDAINALIGQLLAIVEAAVFDAALISIDGLTASVQATAAVTENGIAETSAAATGTIDALKVGGVDVGGVRADLTTSGLATLESQWNDVGSKANAKIDAVLGALGDPYRGLVSVIPVPVAVQTTRIDKTETHGDYAVADASLSLLQVKVTLPVTLPAPQDLATVVTTTPTTTTPTTLVPLTVPAVPMTLPSGSTTVAIPTLPVSFVRAAPTAQVIRGQVATLGSSATIDVGVIAVHAEHTRPGVAITGGAENRTWNSRTGFGEPGSLPKTGGSTAWPLVVFGVLVGVAFVVNRWARASLRKI